MRARNPDVKAHITSWTVGVIFGISFINKFIWPIQYEFQRDILFCLLLLYAACIRDVVPSILPFVSLTLGICTTLWIPSECLFKSFFIFSVGIFHQIEFLLTRIHHGSLAQFKNFLLNNGFPYPLAITAGILEYNMWSFLFPSLRSSLFIVSLIGLSISGIGLLIRLWSVHTAGQSFTHNLRITKTPHHKLITHGLYGYMRHPSYTGWSLWVIGAQIMLLNPVCTLLYIKAVKMFFGERVETEEAALYGIFGDSYLQYRAKTSFAIPFTPEPKLIDIVE